MSLDSTLQPGTVLAGKFRIDRVLGQGGMGVVVAAWHLALEERIALKFLLPHVSEKPEIVQRFLREARNAVKIRSEHVARVTDVGTLDTGMPYMVMEYLEGVDLGQFIEERGPLPVSDAVDLLLQACEAIAEAHSMGIVHRDLKPANLFLTMRADGSPCVKVLDFGISKATGFGSKSDSSLTKTSGMMGSPLYMSPEQLNSARDVDTRTDLWALGVILFEMLTGKQPFYAEDLPQLIVQILNVKPQPLVQLRQDTPPGLQEVIEKMLAKNRDERYSNIGEVVQALAQFGSSRCHLSVDRVSRLMGSMQGMATARNPLSNTGPGDQPRGSAAINLNTNSPWAGTKPNQTSPGTPSSKAPLFAMIAGFLVVVGLVGFFVVRPMLFGGSKDDGGKANASESGDKDKAKEIEDKGDDSDKSKSKSKDKTSPDDTATAKTNDTAAPTTTTTATEPAPTTTTTGALTVTKPTSTATTIKTATTSTAKTKPSATATTAGTATATAKPTSDPFGEGKK
jgi:serine/threonine-protein kinase